MDAIRSIIDGLDWSWPLEMLLSVVPALVCITLHELAHGYVAYRLGDNTARDAGRLTLNPLKHIDIFGLLMMVVFKFGWAKPVPVDMRNFRDPKTGMAITAFAGPLCNLLLACVALFVYGLSFGWLFGAGAFAQTVSDAIATTAYLSIALAIFNIIPIPPLDGSKVLFALLPERAYFTLMRYEKYGMLLLLAIVWSDIIPLGAAATWAFDKLFFIAEFSFGLVNP